jgi:hypothetical protein
MIGRNLRKCTLIFTHIRQPIESMRMMQPPFKKNILMMSVGNTLLQDDDIGIHVKETK